MLYNQQYLKRSQSEEVATVELHPRGLQSWLYPFKLDCLWQLS